MSRAGDTIKNYTSRSGYWCAVCPTRVTIESERSTCYVAPAICPACGGELVALDDLVAHRAIPYPETPTEVRRLHHEWLSGACPVRS